MLWPLLVFVGLHLGYYAFIQRSYFNWYFLPVVLGLSALLGERLGHSSRGEAPVVLLLSAVVCGWSLFLFHDRYGTRRQAAEDDVTPILDRLQDVPAGSRIGAWNAGRIGYFGETHRPDLTFVNLDCVVNNELFSAWKQGRYVEWVQEHVDWLAEEPREPLPAAAAIRMPSGAFRVVPATKR